jgi:hypothetical protein
MIQFVQTIGVGGRLLSSVNMLYFLDHISLFFDARNNGHDEIIMENTPLFGLSEIICPH